MYKTREGVSLVLASGSPRRRELISATGVVFSVAVSDCDESVLPGESGSQMVERLALAKAEVVAAQFPSAHALGADTTVMIDDQILGKPSDADDARRMLSQLRGRFHDVWTAFALVHQPSSLRYTELHHSRVCMTQISDAEIDSYIATGEPMDKAGSYALQGIGGCFIAEVHGSYSNIIGLPISAVVKALQLHAIIEVV